MNIQNNNLADKLIELSKKFGSKDTEVIISNNIETNVEARKGKIEYSETAENSSITLRVINDKKSAVVSANDISEKSLKNLALKANEIAKESLENPFDKLALIDQLADKSKIIDLDIYDEKNINPINSSIFEEMATVADEAACSSSKISNTDGSSSGASMNEFFLCTSNGFKNGYKRSSFYISSTAISSLDDNMEREYAFEHRTHLEDLPLPKDVGDLAAERAINMVGAIKPSTGNYPVIFNNRVSSSIIGHILNAINGDMVTKGSSWLLDRMNDNIIPENYTLIEEPHLPKLYGSRPFDAEGLITKNNVYVKNGVLKSWVLDLKTSNQLGLESTCNAFRSGSALPYPSIGNIELTGGKNTLDDLLKMANEGLMVCSMIGSSINQNNGDYSRGAAGFWFKNGKISHPINECTIAGNLLEMIKTMTIATDIKPHLARRVPSILIDRMTIAGN